MTPVVERAPAESESYSGLLSLICAAHCVSHFYILMLAPLFPIIKAEFGVSYTELGFALLAFNLTSAVFTPPAGYLVDRSGARAVLVGGLFLGAVALAGASVLPSFWGFVAMFALLGLGNTVYHPADYALLSRKIPAPRMGQAYALHTFSGMVGSAAAPPVLLLLANIYGWRGAYLAASGAGFAVAALLMLFGRVLAGPPAAPGEGKTTAQANSGGDKRLLLTAPVLLNLAIFVFLAMMTAGISNYSVAALAALHGTPLAVSNVGLSIYLALSALGVLLGGFIAVRTARHDLAAIASLVVFASAILLIGFVDLGTALLFAVLAVAGACNGVIMPSRDMLVRAVTPPGAFGRVFAFVTNGFNIGGIITPLVFGWLLDHGNPRAVFIAAAAFSLVAIVMVVLNSPRRRGER